MRDIKKIADLTPAELSRFAEYIRENRDIMTDEDVHDLYDIDIDECSGEVVIGSLHYNASAVLKDVDPTAYRCGFNDFTDRTYYDLNDYSLGDGWIDVDPDDLLDDFVDDVLLVFRYTYSDERGDFSGSVVNWNDEEIYSISQSEETGELEIIVDGFMKHTQDMDGLTAYLIDLEIIPDGSIINYEG